MHIRKRVLSTTLAFAICVTALYASPAGAASAATTYITVEAFAQSLATELGLSSLEGTASSGYVNTLIDKGIIKEGDFNSYTSNLTRGDAMVLLNRADEYLYGDKLDEELVQMVIDKRISDINNVKEVKRADVAKAYLKGYMKGYTNGAYCTDRNMKLTSKITKTGALGCIKLLKDKKLRAKISPDGQLIRTTNLPKSAKLFPYILASYPNSYYDWHLIYEDSLLYYVYNPKTGNMEEHKFEYIKDYASPVDIDKTTDIPDFAQLKKEKLDTWVEKAKTYMYNIFNVDYRTMGQEWVDTVASVYIGHDQYVFDENTKEQLKKYIDGVKKEKTIIECSKVAVDGSSLYYYYGRYYLRAFVRYRIVSTQNPYKGSAYYEHNSLIYMREQPLQFDDITFGKWKEDCFDVELAAPYNEPENLGVNDALIDEFYQNFKY